MTDVETKWIVSETTLFGKDYLWMRDGHRLYLERAPEPTTGTLDTPDGTITVTVPLPE